MNYNINIFASFHYSYNASSSKREKTEPLLSINNCFFIVNVTDEKPLATQEIRESIYYSVLATMKGSFLQNEGGLVRVTSKVAN